MCQKCMMEFATVPYVKKYHDNLNNKFNRSEEIDKNYSQSFQDMFVLHALNGKENGTYLEIGSGHFSELNNTYLLESMYSWSGCGIDIDSNLTELYNSNRTNKCYSVDALEEDYGIFIKNNFFTNYIDYLQIDCDPAISSLAILNRIPFDEVSFGVITFEHDFYCDKDKTVKSKSREILLGKGYVLAVPNVCSVPGLSYEDWWVNPKYINVSFLNLDLNKNTDILKYMLKDVSSKKSIFCNH